MNNLDKSLEYFSTGLQGYSKLQLDWGIIPCLLNISKILHEQNKYSQALETLTSALKISEKAGYHHSTASIYEERGAILSDINKTIESNKNYEKALSIPFSDLVN